MAGPIEQFEIKSLLPIAEVGGHQISFTNSAAYMVLTVAIASLFLILSTRRHGLVPDRAQAAAEILYEFAAKTLRDNAGEKGMRFALPNARIMVHQPSGGYQGQVTDILIHAREVESLKRRLNEIYVHHTGRDYKTIEEALERDNFFTSEAALEFGLIDKVIEKRAAPAEGK